MARLVYVLLGSILLIFLLTVFPFYAAIMRGFGPYANRLAMSVMRAPSFADAFGNIIVFIPFGFAAIRLTVERLTTSRLVHAAAIIVLGGCLSFMIEGAQMLMPRRSPSLYDIAFNTLGTAVGVGLGLWRLWLLERARRTPPTAA